MAALLLIGFLLVCLSSCSFGANFQIGRGIADITGPAAQVNMMGYAQASQITSGIHLRQYSRAFIIGDHKSRVVYVNVDACMISTVLKVEVVKRLSAKFGDLYTDENVLLSGIHTHSGPGGFHQYILLDITTFGFVPQALNALIDGIVKSIENAHSTYQPGDLYLNEGELLDASINRSPTAYLNNPSAERARYSDNTDKTMTMLKMVDQNNKGVGALSWFAVHCTSMNFTNTLISGDNKGYASQLFEKEMNGPGVLAGRGDFVAAFGQSNEGDVSPNTKGPHCLDTGLPCDVATSTCNGKAGLCIASGPGKDMVESTRIIGEKQFAKAKALYDQAGIATKLMGSGNKLSGRVKYRHAWVDMTQVVFPFNSTHKAKTCKPAMGFSFAAGTTDGPTDLNFKQGAIKGNAFWTFVSSILSKPSTAEQACHAPKPILLNTGAMTFPYAWQPAIAPVQIFEIGKLIILGVPGEFTTMAGRRLREAVKEVLVQNGYSSDITVTVAGLSNTYVDYIVTYEEYQIQRYEGASTIYGPHTLGAFIYKFTEMAAALAKDVPLKSTVHPPDLLSKQITFQTGVVMDSPPIFKKFGDVLKDVRKSYSVGMTAVAEFVTGHPKNNLRQGGSFLMVMKKSSGNVYTTVYEDSDWSTRYEWKRTNGVLGHSKAIISWKIPMGTSPGVYRLQHCGDAKNLFGKRTTFCGSSSDFRVSS